MLHSGLGNNRGISFVIVLTIAVMTTFIVLALMPIALNDRQVVVSQANGVRAFYAAESGINVAFQALTDSDWTGWDTTTNPALFTLPLQNLVDSGGNTIARYEVELDLSNADTRIAESTGYSPTTADIERSMRVTFVRLEAVIIAKGGVDIKGNAQINGDISEYTEFYFETIFGDTIANIKGASTTQVVIDPPNNHSPVPSPAEGYTDANSNGQYDVGEAFVDDDGDGEWDNEKNITWFEIVDSDGAMITTNSWAGSGILVVEDGDLTITGGNFDGIVWVMGNLRIAGNATINGTIFVDGTVEDITEISGTPTISYSEAEIIAAFGGNPLPFVKGPWSEIYK